MKIKNIKIGILTLYYHNYNYGGVLQSYALPKAISKIGYDAQQVCYDPFSIKIEENKKPLYRRIYNNVKKYGLGKAFLIYKQTIINKTWKIKKHINNKDISETVYRRHSLIDQFKNSKIPHSNKVYNDKNISNCDYNLLISGSDQVWLKQNKHFSNAYLLNINNDKIIKCSYAAGPNIEDYSKDDQEFLISCLSNYKHISVREPETNKCIKNLFKEKDINKSVTTVLDPVFLLSKEEWLSIASEKPLIKGDYIFLYMLGNNKKLCNYVHKLSIAHNLKILTFPYPLDKYTNCNYDFGNANLVGGPEDFISAINNAKFIITDSFHAVSMSIILEKKFCVIDRVTNNIYLNPSNNRINNVLNVANCRERKFNINGKLSALEKLYLSDIDYKYVNIKLQDQINASWSYIDKLIKINYHE